MADLTAKINRVATNVKNSLSEVANKGVTVPASANSDNLPALIASIESGTELTLTATTKSDLSVSGVADSTGVCMLNVPDDGEWIVVAALNGDISVEAVASLSTKDSVELPFINPILNNNAFDVISAAASQGIAANYWSIGDRKAVNLNGTVGTLTFSDETVYAFIIGFDHNREKEGTRRIHFQLANTALSSGKDIAFCDTAYGTAVSSNGYFSMNISQSNSGGWEKSKMRNNICGTNLSDYEGTILAVIPSELRTVLKPVTKYTNNVGSSEEESAITATTDYFFVLAEYELFGTIKNANEFEASYQKQYDYYAAGNSKIKYNHGEINTAVHVWNRSPRAGSSTGFVRTNTSGASTYNGATNSQGFAPAFCV